MNYSPLILGLNIYAEQTPKVTAAGKANSRGMTPLISFFRTGISALILSLRIYLYSNTQKAWRRMLVDIFYQLR
jgi:hypothetical protein